MPPKVMRKTSGGISFLANDDFLSLMDPYASTSRLHIPSTTIQTIPSILLHTIIVFNGMHLDIGCLRVIKDIWNLW